VKLVEAHDEGPSAEIIRMVKAGVLIFSAVVISGERSCVDDPVTFVRLENLQSKDAQLWACIGEEERCKPVTRDVFIGPHQVATTEVGVDVPAVFVIGYGGDSRLRCLKVLANGSLPKPYPIVNVSAAIDCTPEQSGDFISSLTEECRGPEAFDLQLRKGFPWLAFFSRKQSACVDAKSRFIDV
jgi:hypothetical protein